MSEKTYHVPVDVVVSFDIELPGKSRNEVLSFVEDHELAEKLSADLVENAKSHALFVKNAKAKPFVKKTGISIVKKN